MHLLAILIFIVGQIPATQKKAYVIENYNDATKTHYCDSITSKIYTLNDTTSIGNHLNDIIKVYATIADRSVYYYSFTDTVSNQNISLPQGDEIYSYLISLEQNSGYEIIHIYPYRFDCDLNLYPLKIDGVMRIKQKYRNSEYVDFFICNQLKSNKLFDKLFIPTNSEIRIEPEIITLNPEWTINYGDKLDMYIGLINNNNLETMCYIVNNKILINKIPKLGPIIQ